MSKYEGKSLPELYFIAVKRNVKDFFGKKEAEMVELLDKLDETEPNSDDDIESNDKPVKSGNNKTSTKKGAKAVGKKIVEEDIIDVDEDEAPVKKSKRKDESDDDAIIAGDDDEDDVPFGDDADDTEDEEEVKPVKKAAKKSAKKVEEEPEEEPEEADEEESEIPAKKVNLKKMSRDELKTFIKEQGLDMKVYKSDDDDDIRNKIKEALAGETDADDSDDSDESDDDETPKKKESAVAKKEKPAKSVEKAVEKKATVEKKVAAKKTEKKAAPNFEKLDRNPKTSESPYRAGTAGACCFAALIKGGTMEQIVARTDALIEKVAAKPPKDTKAKLKIIMTEINAGKHGKWGEFSDDGKKITYSK